MLRLSGVQCFTDVLQRAHIFQQKWLFISPLLFVRWRTADRLITETCSSGILSKTEVLRKHLVLVISLGSPQPRELTTYSLDCFPLSMWKPLAGDPEIRPETKQPGAASGRGTTGPGGEMYFQGRGKNAHRALMMSRAGQVSQHATHQALTDGEKVPLVALWLEGKPTWSHPIWEQKSPSQLRRLFDIVARLPLRLRASSSGLRSRKGGAAMKPEDNEKLTRKRGTPVI